MKKTITVIISIVCWVAVIVHFCAYLISLESIAIQDIATYLSYYSTHINVLVASFFSMMAFSYGSKRISDHTNALTAFMLYCVTFGIIYQLLLRQSLDQIGVYRFVANELAHTILPLCVLMYWAAYTLKKRIRVEHVPRWLAYPIVYIIGLLIMGKLMGFHPYSFIDDTQLSFIDLLQNILILFAIFLTVSYAIIGVGKILERLYQQPFTDDRILPKIRDEIVHEL